MGWKAIKSAASENPEKHSLHSGRLAKAESMAILAERLFAHWHEQELAADPKAFLTGVVELFCNYPIGAVQRAISPVFGLPGKFKFPPRISEIKAFLDEQMVPIYREEQRQARLLPPDPSVQRESRPTYAELKAKYGDNWGLGADAPKAKWQPPTADELRAMIGDDEWNRIPDAARPV